VAACPRREHREQGTTPSLPRTASLATQPAAPTHNPALCPRPSISATSPLRPSPTGPHPAPQQPRPAGKTLTPRPHQPRHRTPLLAPSTPLHTRHSGPRHVLSPLHTHLPPHRLLALSPQPAHRSHPAACTPHHPPPPPAPSRPTAARPHLAPRLPRRRAQPRPASAALPPCTSTPHRTLSTPALPSARSPSAGRPSVRLSASSLCRPTSPTSRSVPLRPPDPSQPFLARLPHSCTAPPRTRPARPPPARPARRGRRTPPGTPPSAPTNQPSPPRTPLRSRPSTTPQSPSTQHTPGIQPHPRTIPRADGRTLEKSAAGCFMVPAPGAQGYGKLVALAHHLLAHQAGTGGVPSLRLWRPGLDFTPPISLSGRIPSLSCSPANSNPWLGPCLRAPAGRPHQAGSGSDHPLGDRGAGLAGGGSCCRPWEQFLTSDARARSMPPSKLPSGSSQRDPAAQPEPVVDGSGGPISSTHQKWGTGGRLAQAATLPPRARLLSASSPGAPQPRPTSTQLARVASLRAHGSSHARSCRAKRKGLRTNAAFAA